MRRTSIASLVIVAIASGLGLAACGSSGSPASRSTAPETTVTAVQKLSSPSWTKAGPNPSKEAKMVCEEEVRDDLAESLGVKATSVTKPIWNQAKHIYSCTYVYPNGKITLNVKDMSSEAETTAYFEGLQKKYGKRQELIGLGQGGWILKNNDVVVRKDYKVLHVDASQLPKQFQPMMRPSDAATNVAVTIMGCWIGE